MGRKNLNGGALLAPIPPAIVSVGDMEKHNVLTVAWTGILSTVPPKTYISVRPSRYSYEILKERGEFVINLPSADMARNVDFVGIYTGRKMDKLEKCGLTPIPSERVKAPTVAECPIAIECRVTDVLPMGSHDVFIADILSVSCRDELIDAEGKLHFEQADLLAYAHGEYYSLGERVGRFGFSTDKPGSVAKSTKNTTKGRGKGDKPSSAVVIDRDNLDGGRVESKVKMSSIKAEVGRFTSEFDRKSGGSVAKTAKSAPKIDVVSPEYNKNTKNGIGKIKSGASGEKEGVKPFYLGMPRGKRGTKVSNKDKGKPHGRKKQ